jgi:pseudouridine kinase
MHRLSRAQAWVIDANLSDDALSYLFENYSDMTIWADPVSTIKAKRLTPYLSKVHCLTPNLQEAGILAGLAAKDSQDAPALAQTLHEKGVKQLLITLGEHGAFASDGETSAWLPAKSVSVQNVTGCGDAAIAALVHGAVSGLNWENSCDLAMSAAALTASTIQTNSPLLSTLGNPA